MQYFAAQQDTIYYTEAFSEKAPFMLSIFDKIQRQTLMTDQ